ncbi:MAG: hypothetical protein CL609_23855 [Anaerolineaceae bacterium]|nr:hypothetical protein [Anaerolineaceae bacterium]
MINRKNYADVLYYLDYSRRVLQLADASIHNIRGYLRHLLEWADERSFDSAKEIDPSFPVYLLSARNSGGEGQLAPSTMKKTCEYARRFFDFCRNEWPKKYKNLSLNWIDTIRPPRSKGMHSELQQHDFYDFESIQKIAALVPESLREERDIAAACYLYLSGMRADAFISMPIKAVDMQSHRVSQLPKLGVRTKNHKAAITTLLPIQALIDICDQWNDKVRANLPDDALWYAPIKGDGENLLYRSYASKGRRRMLEKGIKNLCKKTGIEYKSPHKFRHGHVVFALSRVKDMAELKAVSQNVMHSSVGITDSIYGNLVDDKVHSVISNIGVEKKKETPNLENLVSLFTQMIRENPGLISGQDFHNEG